MKEARVKIDLPKLLEKVKRLFGEKISDMQFVATLAGVETRAALYDRKMQGGWRIREIDLFSANSNIPVDEICDVEEYERVKDSLKLFDLDIPFLRVRCKEKNPGKKATLGDISRIVGISPPEFTRRNKLGWSRPQVEHLERAFNLKPGEGVLTK